MASRSSILPLLLGIVALFAVFTLMSPKKAASSTGGGSSGSGSGGSASGSSPFPVTISSAPADIISAFKQSGYFAQLDPAQQSSATDDPQSWLQDHPYLYRDYPQYFSGGTPQTAGYSSPHGE